MEVAEREFVAYFSQNLPHDTTSFDRECDNFEEVARKCRFLPS